MDNRGRSPLEPLSASRSRPVAPRHTKLLELDRQGRGPYAGSMPDLLPEDRIKGKEQYLRDLQPGESILVSPVAFSVTPERFLAIPKTISLDRLVFRLELMGKGIRLGRE